MYVYESIHAWLVHTAPNTRIVFTCVAIDFVTLRNIGCDRVRLPRQVDSFAVQ